MPSALFFSPSAFVYLSINAKVKQSITFFLIHSFLIDMIKKITKTRFCFKFPLKIVLLNFAQTKKFVNVFNSR